MQLFLGTAKYPEPGEFNAFLSSHGGSSNAFTDSEDTNYYFSVASESLEGGLDRFAQFFTAPVFNASSAALEMRAVDSEHQKNLQQDPWRAYQLLKAVSSPTTPFHGFATGNLATLNRTGVRAALLAFHAAHYTAPRMRLTVVSPHPTEVVARWAARMFASVPAVPRDPVAALLDERRRSGGGSGGAGAITGAGAGVPSPGGGIFAGLTPAEVRAAAALVAAAGDIAARASVTLAPGAVFPEGSPPRASRIDARPVADKHALTLLFPLPPQRTADDVRVSAMSTVASLLGDEGVGSALSYLRAAHLAERLGVDIDVDSSGFALFRIEVVLSPAVVAAAKNAAAAGGNSAVLVSLHEACDQVAGSVFAHIAAAVADVEAAAAYAAAVPVALGGCLPPPPSPSVSAAHAVNPLSGELLSCPGNDTTHLSFRAWRDASLLAAAAFRFPDKPDAEQLASDLAKTLHRVGPDDVLSPPWRRVWQPAAILAVLRALTPASAIFLLESAALPLALLSLTEPIYGTAYALERVAPADLERLAKAPDAGLPPRLDGLPVFFALPPPNPFLPATFGLVDHAGYGSQLGLVEHPSERGGDAAPVASGKAGTLHAMLLPVADQLAAAAAPPGADALIMAPSSHAAQLAVLRASPFSLLWLPDGLFGRPRSHVGVELASAAAAASPTAEVLTALWVAAAKSHLSETLYEFERGGTRVSVSPLSFGAGVSISIEGYSAVVPAVLEALMVQLLAPSILPARVAMALDSAARDIRNARKEQPYRRAAYWGGSVLLGARRHSQARLYAAIEALAGGSVGSSADITVANVTALAEVVRLHGAAILANLSRVNVFVYGNENVTTARAYSATLVRSLAASSPAFVRTSIAAGATAAALANSSLQPPLQFAPEGTPFTEVASLAPGRTLLQVAGENPSDTNGAVVVRYQVGLRDSCRLETRPLLFAAAAPRRGARSGAALIELDAAEGAKEGAQDEHFQQLEVEQPSGPQLRELASSHEVVGSYGERGARRTQLLMQQRRQHDSGGIISPSPTSDALSAIVSVGAEPPAASKGYATNRAESSRQIRQQRQPVQVGDSIAEHAATTTIAFVDRAMAAADQEHAFRLSGVSIAPDVFSRARRANRRRLLARVRPTGGSSSADVDLWSLRSEEALEAAAAAGLVRRQLTARSGSSGGAAGRWLLSLREDRVAPAMAELRADCTLRGAAFSVLTRLLHEPAFDELRTRQQLGYIVAVQSEAVDTLVRGAGTADVAAALPAYRSDGGAGLALTLGVVERPVSGDVMQSAVFVVQGTAAPPDRMDAAVAAFVGGFEAARLGEMGVDEWLAALDGLEASALIPAPRSMPAAFEWEWEEVLGRSFRPGRRADAAAALSRLRLEHVVALFREGVSGGGGGEGGGARPRRLAVEVFGAGQALARPGGLAAPDVIVDASSVAAA